MARSDESTRPGATSAQLKGDIDSGRTGDKLAGFDPGAAPLGTDDEAGGAPHDPDLMAWSRREERSGRPTAPTPHASTPDLQPDARLPRGGAVALPILIGILAAAAVALLLILLL